MLAFYRRHMCGIHYLTGVAVGVTVAVTDWSIIGTIMLAVAASLPALIQDGRDRGDREVARLRREVDRLRADQFLAREPVVLNTPRPVPCPHAVPVNDCRICW
jgi:hypothetical protein